MTYPVPPRSRDVGDGNDVGVDVEPAAARCVRQTNGWAVRAPPRASVCAPLVERGAAALQWRSCIARRAAGVGSRRSEEPSRHDTPPDIDTHGSPSGPRTARAEAATAGAAGGHGPEDGPRQPPAGLDRPACDRPRSRGLRQDDAARAVGGARRAAGRLVDARPRGRRSCRARAQRCPGTRVASARPPADRRRKRRRAARSRTALGRTAGRARAGRRPRPALARIARAARHARGARARRLDARPRRPRPPPRDRTRARPGACSSFAPRSSR